MKKILIILLLLWFLFLPSGCAWFEDKRVAVKPKVDMTLLRTIINNRYDREYLKCAAADLALAEYNLSLE